MDLDEEEAGIGISESFISILESVCFEESGHKTRSGFFREIAPEVARLSDRFNRIGGSLVNPERSKDPFYTKGAHLAYLAYFLPANFLKISYLLAECMEGISAIQEEKPIPPKLAFLDLGAGPGTNGLGLLDFSARYRIPYFQDREISICSVDRDREFLKYSETLFRRYREVLAKPLAERNIRFHFKTEERKIPGGLPEEGTGYHFIFAGNLINELSTNGSVKSPEKLGAWIGDLLGALAPGGRMILIEPALRETSRALLSLRNRLSDSGRGTILFPCLHQGLCPILAPGGSEKDWCHQEKSWNPPEWVTELDALTGLRKDSLKYSGLILCRSGAAVSHPAGEWRVVSELIATKGKKELFLCNGSGRKRFYLLDKEKSGENRAFHGLRRGDKIVISGEDKSGKTRIGPGWKVKKSP